MGRTTPGDGKGDIVRQPGGNWSPDEPRICDLLSRAEVAEVKLLPSGSNYVFAAVLRDDEAGDGIAVYKPRRGEAPLHDFPDGTLYRRERAAYLVSEALGWRIVPPTVVRDGPHGIGIVQLYIEHRPRANFFTLRDTRMAELRRMAIFDVLTNNADRKGGHCLEAVDGHIWGIDHGLTFHHQRKLRTVIWDYAGEPVEPALIRVVRRFRDQLRCEADGLAELGELLHPRELKALTARIEELLNERCYPEPPPWRSVPWPPV